MEDLDSFAALPIIVSSCAFRNLKITPYRSGTTSRKDLNLISFPWTCTRTRPLADVDKETNRGVKRSAQFTSRRESWDKKVLKVAKPKISDSQMTLAPKSILIIIPPIFRRRYFELVEGRWKPPEQLLPAQTSEHRLARLPLDHQTNSAGQA